MEKKKGWWKTMLKLKEQENLISKVLKLETESATKIGDNFSGVLNRVKIEILLKSGKKRKISVIMKEMPSSEHRRSLNEQFNTFRREIMVYRDLLPAMESVMREFNDFTELMWGQMLYFKPYDSLCLFDLSSDGYKMLDRRIGLDLEHCLLVARSLAKFHATSVILKERGQLCMELFKEHVMQDKACQKLNETFLPDAFNRLADLVDTWQQPEWKTIADQLRNKIAPNVIEMELKLFSENETNFNVLCHGDCWINNMLFKYGLDGVSPIGVKFIDFQISFYNSPAFDLKYFLASSQSLEIRKTNVLPQILEAYQKSLAEQLELYSYKGNVITLDQLHNEMRRIDLFGVQTSVSILPVVHQTNAENMDLEHYLKDLVEKNEINKETWRDYFKPPPIFAEIMKITLKDVIDNKILFV